MEGEYSKIKKHSLQNSVITQVMLESKRMSMKVPFPYFGKITLQILAKNGV